MLSVRLGITVPSLSPYTIPTMGGYLFGYLEIKAIELSGSTDSYELLGILTDLNISLKTSKFYIKYK